MIFKNQVASRRRPITNCYFFVLLSIIVSLSLSACSRLKAKKELQLNAYFAEILKREDRRELGEDSFLRDQLLGHPSPVVRQWCAIALGRIASPQALPWLYEATRDRYASVRAAAAFAIGQIEDRGLLHKQKRLPDPQARAQLVGLLDDTSLAVRTRAVEALGKIGGPSEAAEIVRRLEHFDYRRSPEWRTFVGYSIVAMARIKDPIAMPTLGKLAQSADEEIRQRAQDALARLQSGSEGIHSKPVLAAQAEASPFEHHRITDAMAYALAADRKNSTIAILETTRGIIEMELFREHASATTAYFVLQARGGRLDGMEFTRCSPSILSARKPDSVALSAPLRSEINMIPFGRGSVGMALCEKNQGAPGFFIAITPQPYLDGIYTCFGRVISGMQVAEKMVSGDRINRIRIRETVSFHNRLKY